MAGAAVPVVAADLSAPGPVVVAALEATAGALRALAAVCDLSASGDLDRLVVAALALSDRALERGRRFERWCPGCRLLVPAGQPCRCVDGGVR